MTAPRHSGKGASAAPNLKGTKRMGLIKSTTWNILGVVIPSLVAIPAMGVIARILGVEKFGLFTIAFAIVGYSSIFDAGLTRAVIRAVAINRGNDQKVSQIIGTATWAVIALSVVATVALFVGVSSIVTLLNVSSENTPDAISGFRWLSFSIAPFLLGMIWFSYLEGEERFAELNKLKMGTSLGIALLPLAAILITKSLTAAIVGLVIGRYFAATVAFIRCRSGIGGRVLSFDRATLSELIVFGGWITVSNVISPIMVYFDRFILSHFGGAQQVAYYTAPAEAIARMSIVPGAVARSLFPKLSKAGNDAGQQARAGFWGIAAATLLMVVPVFIFAELILTTWLGPDFGGETATILRILLIGFLFNSVAQIPFTKIQARGHSKTTAMVHLAELGPYMLALYILIAHYSIVGAAVAWTLRTSVDFAIFQILATRLSDESRLDA